MLWTCFSLRTNFGVGGDPVPSKVNIYIYIYSKSFWFEKNFRKTTMKRFPKIRIIQSCPPSAFVWICFNFFLLSFLTIL